MSALSGPLCTAPILTALSYGTADAIVPQIDVQILAVGIPNAIVPQIDIQVLGIGKPAANVSQIAVEVLGYVPWRNGTTIVIV